MNNLILTAGAAFLMALYVPLNASEQDVSKQPSAPESSELKPSPPSLEQRMSPEERQRFNYDLQNHSGTVYPDHDQIESRRQLMRLKIQERLQRADTDHDNSISRSEAEENMPGLARHFDEIDANHDGIITIDEMKAVYDKKREVLDPKLAKDKEKESLLPIEKKRGKKDSDSATDKPKRGKKQPSQNDSAPSDSASSLS
ncbi:uncharacterized protein NMK_0169 [Novimethylophilus kurashikiensis]|uniref:EF-hand domain-containing protein n=1 Tax=Novimethylophilus kurashikiensis TaxID=1825523 RepID=A0A2R5F4G8_9PROT|nr:hypothetical protein [Novimethylophilus kurashikiensis]GBG12638.1 uncharacterized protein NMK_0169 [Novimethylophilus kurashikiensis]